MRASVTQQGPHLRRTIDSAVRANADNNFLHVCHYDSRINETAPVPLLGQEMGQEALRIPADLHVARSRDFRLKLGST